MSVTKPYQSPFQVTYDDLIAEAEERLKCLQANARPGWPNTHRIEVQKKTVVLLKKFRIDPQVNLFDEFKKG